VGPDPKSYVTKPKLNINKSRLSKQTVPKELNARCAGIQMATKINVYTLNMGSLVTVCDSVKQLD